MEVREIYAVSLRHSGGLRAAYDKHVVGQNTLGGRKKRLEVLHCV